MYIFNEIWNGILMKKTVEKEKKITFSVVVVRVSGGELLEIGLLHNHLLDTFGRKSTARHKIYQLLESSKCLLNWIRADDKNIVNCWNPV